MKKKQKLVLAARQAARLKVIPPKQEELKSTHPKIETESFAEEVLKPIARMLGHTLSSALAYGVWCAAEVAIARLLPFIFRFGSHHQAELFEVGESIMFYSGFVIWFVSFLVGAIRMVVAETKLFEKKK
ncbi:hypothetical protein [Pseudoduganella sp. R-34]|uniref:hypothetical protein n=1 Tax=Pseudoduganella sp. R-34 TaxID=3404062 RepID=UPI003CF3AD14